MRGDAVVGSISTINQFSGDSVGHTSITDKETEAVSWWPGLLLS